jgi:hypothetical protein
MRVCSTRRMTSEVTRDLLLVAGVSFTMGIMTYHTIVVWQRTYSKEAKEEKQQTALEARVMEEYQPQHRADEVTHIVQPRWQSSKKWRP